MSIDQGEIHPPLEATSETKAAIRTEAIRLMRGQDLDVRVWRNTAGEGAQRLGKINFERRRRQPQQSFVEGKMHDSSIIVDDGRIVLGVGISGSTLSQDVTNDQIDFEQGQMQIELYREYGGIASLLELGVS